MALENKNVAYDFSLFEEAPQRAPQSKPNNVIQIPQEKLERNRRRKLKPFAVASFLVFTLISLAIVGTMIYSQVQLTELTAEINSKKTELAEAESLYTQLEMKAEAKLSLKKVEEYATQQLGMRKLESYQVEYITLSEGDKVVVNEGVDSISWWEAIFGSGE